MALPGISRFANRVALVTGASVGIGAAIADTLAKQGLKVVGCARNPGPIETHAEHCVKNGYAGKLLPYKCDISKEDEIETMFAWIEQNHGGVDVCINNAGYAVVEPLLDSDAGKIRDMLNVNFVGLVMCSKLAVKSMQSRGVDDGHIININSVSGHRLSIRYCYAASKFAVTALTQGFRRELHEIGSHIRVTSISPGMVKTHFHYAHYGAEGAEEMYETKPVIQAEDVANAVLHALSQPANVQVEELLISATEAKP